MAKGPRTVLALPDGIAAHRDLPDSAEIEPLPGGCHNDVLRLCEVVVRLERRDPASVAWEHELLRWLADRFVAVYRAAGGPGETTVMVAARRIQLAANLLAHFTLTQSRPHRDWVDDLLSELRALP